MRQLAGKALRRLKRLGLKPGEAPAILMYHRIADPPYDPWSNCVTPRNFACQLEYLATNHTPMSVDDLVAALDARDLPQHAIAVTFDDGYADNLRAAKPMLDHFGVPATFFLTTDLIGKKAGYWWDELADLVLSGTTSVNLDVTIAGLHLLADYPAQDELPCGLKDWTVESGRHGHPRQTAYVALWGALQSMDAADREVAMAIMRSCLGNGEPLVAPARDALPMDWSMVLNLAAQGGSIGAHARSHTPLDIVPVDQQRQEIFGSRDDLTSRLGTIPSGFAYPHGQFEAATRNLVEEAGFGWAVTSNSQIIHPRRYDRHALPRIVVENWNRQAFSTALRQCGA